jgi:stage II sporulation protein D
VTLRERSASRRVSCLRLSFRKGHVDLAGDEIRWTLRRANGEGLRSALLTRVQATRRRGRIVSLRVEGQGYGHGVGLCQYGAMGMAEAGYGHQEIIRFYYRGTQVRRFY